MPKFDDLAQPSKWLRDLTANSEQMKEEALDEHFLKLRFRPECSEIQVSMENVENGRNRYPDVPCLDETRVKVTSTSDNGDFIHASYVKLPHLSYTCILAQGPTDETTNDFWSVLWNEKVTVIVCLTKLIEGGLKRTHEYWPTSVGNKFHQRHGDLFVRTVGIKNHKTMAQSVLEVGHAKTKERRLIQHYFYMDWMEHQVPTRMIDFMTMVEYVQSEMKNVKLTSAPKMLIHASAGINRPATMAAILELIGAIDNGERPNIAETVSMIRKQRALAIQDGDQYLFIHYALATHIMHCSTLPFDLKAEMMSRISLFHRVPESELKKKSKKYQITKVKKN